MKIYFLLFGIGIIYFSLCLCNITSAKTEGLDSTALELKYTASDLRDPFKEYLPRIAEIKELEQKGREGELDKTEKTLPSFSVQGIIWGTKLPQAIVDGQVVEVGDKIEEAEIIKINKEGITFLYQDEQYKVPVEHTSYKTIEDIDIEEIDIINR